MLKFLLALVLGIIAAEIAVFVAAIQLFGGLAVLAAILVTGIAGSALLRRQSLKALSSLNPRSTPSTFEAIASGSWLALAGLLLIFPGFLADAVGILLIIGPIRRFLTKHTARWFFVNPKGYAVRPNWNEPGPVIEGKAIEMPDEPDDERPLIR